MIEFLKSWCESIIVAIFISMIIEAILPEGNNKKYVKVVIGIYIIMTIFTPFLNKLNLDIDFSNFAKTENVGAGLVPAQPEYSENIIEVYTNGIEQNLKQDIEENFNVKLTKLEIIYDENYENIESINLSIQNSSVAQIEKVEIGKNQENIKNEAYQEIKKYIAENYNLDESKILVD